MTNPLYRNTILQRLGTDAIQRLHLSPVRFEVGHEIEFPGSPIAHLFFVEDGMASMTTTFRDGSQVEVGMFGFESIIGVSALMGSKRSLNRVYTQVAGHGFRTSVTLARAEFQRGEIFSTLALRYVQAQLLQTAQSAGCNARHSIEQRLARWLLLTADRVHNTQFTISQAFLASMVGNTRTGVSRAAVALKAANLIRYSRGVVTILDPVGLEQRSCECYRIVRDHLDNYAEFSGRDLH